MAALLARLGALAHRRRWTVVAVWLAVLVAGGAGAATLAGETTTSFSIPGQESTVALERISEEFGAADSGASAQVVVRAPEGTTLTDPTQAAELQQLVTDLGTLPGVASASDPLDPASPAVNPDLTTGYSTVTYDAAPGEVTPAEQDALRGAVADARGAGLTVEVAGQALESAPEVGGVGEVAVWSSPSSCWR